MKHLHLATRLYNTPLLIEPNKAAVIERIFRQHQSAELQDGVTRPAAMEDEDRPNRGPERTESATLGKLVRRPEKQYDMTTTGIAVIPVVGTLVQRTGGMQPFSGMVPYAYVGRKLQAAIEDPEVKAVLLEIDSYGGEVNGCFELAEQIVKARSIKPVWACANEAAYSAAYAIGSAASRLYLPNTAGCCNIGVIALHVDQSKLDARVGVAYTYIYAGARKADGNPHEPLSDRARTDMQDEIDRLHGIFCAHVAMARGIDIENVIATQAAALNPDQAVAGNFADGIKTFAETVTALEAVIAPSRGTVVLTGTLAKKAAAGLSSTHEKENHMSTKITAAAIIAALSAEQQPVMTAHLDEAAATARAEGVKEGETAGRSAERARIAGILNHAEAKDRGALALSIATETEMSVEQAGKVLAAASKHNASNALASVMAGLKNPEIGAGGGEGGDSAEAEVGKILAVCRQNGVAVAKAA